MVKNQPARAGDARDAGLIPRSGRSPGERNGNPLQYSFLGNSMCREIWWAPVHGVTKSQARLSTDTHTHTHTHPTTTLSSLQVSGASFTCTFIFKFCESKRLSWGVAVWVTLISLVGVFCIFQMFCHAHISLCKSENI